MIKLRHTQLQLQAHTRKKQQQQKTKSCQSHTSRHTF